jgi:predicted nucleic acid-binding protein
MIYLDANVFVAAALYRDDTAEEARKLIQAIEDGGVKAATSTLTYDEVYWAVKNFKGRKAAHRAGSGVLMLPNLNLLEVGRGVLHTAHDLLANSSLDPRDAIHAACALTRGIKTVVSEDKHFDRIKGIKRASIKDFK